jgi:hypothetical protein
VGNFYYDCGSLGTPGSAGTYSLDMATGARAAYPLPGGKDTVGSCPGTGGTTLSVLVRYNDTTFATWVYSGQFAGFVTLNNAGNASRCPTTASPGSTWD